MENNFVSQENKAMLWDLLYSESAFNDIDNSKLEKVKHTFDQIISNKNISMKNDSLLKKNKEVLKCMMNELNDIKNEEIVIHSKQNSENNIKHKFDAQKNEFEKLINPPSPEKINFSDELDQPISGDMSAIINTMHNERQQQENEIKKTQPSEKKAKQWLKIKNSDHTQSSSDLEQIDSFSEEKSVSMDIEKEITKIKKRLLLLENHIDTL